MRIIENLEQGTQAWLDARAGKATASNFHRILTPPGKRWPTGKPSAQRDDYACEIIAEKLVDGPDPWRDDYQSADMQRGTFSEAEARKFYAFERDCEVRQVGFCVHDNGFWGCSPDGLVEPDGGVEIKCPRPSTQVRYFLDGVVPAKYRPQVHGCLIVTGRAWWDFLSYCPGLPPLLLRVTPDEYTKQLEAALVEFKALYDDLLAKVLAARDAAIDAAIRRQAAATPKPLKSFVL